MKILGFGTYDKTTHPRVGTLLEGLRHRGYQVSELNFPLGIDTAGRVKALSSVGSLIAFGLTVVSRWIKLCAGSSRFRRASSPEVVLVGYLGHFDVVLARLLFPRAKIVLDHLIFAADTAKDRGVHGRVKMTLLRGIDNLALRSSDLILVDTPQHRAMVPQSIKKPVLVVPVGAPSAWFAARHQEEASNPSFESNALKVVFFGLFTPLQGAPAIAEALALAGAETPLRITMVGTGQDYPQCRQALKNQNVTWLDWVDSVDLPGLVADNDVCIGILGTTSKALHVVPNKVYQGMATGCLVITSDTIPQRATLGNAALFCAPGDALALANTIKNVASDKALLARMKKAAAAKADASFRPEEIVEPLAEALS